MLVLILIVLIYLSSYFSSAETALTAVNRLRLRSMAEDGDPRAAKVLKILEDQPRMLTAILIGNNVVNLSASALTTVMASKLGGKWSIALGTGLLTLVILLFGEITPKTMATIQAEKISLRTAPVIWTIMQLFTPVIWLIGMMSRLILKFMHINVDDNDGGMTEDELRTMVEVSHEEGVIASDEKEMINNVFDLGDSQARDVMVPRVDVVFADIEAGYQEILDLFKENRFTRIPIYEETPDHVVGILNMKDLVLYRQDQAFSVRDFLREPYYTHEFKSTTELLREMRKARVTISIVLDEYGDTVGIITMEDIVEEIVGEIRDEFDEEELEAVQKVGEGEYLVEGSYRLDDLNDVLGTTLVSQDYDSIGGFLVSVLDHIPEEGEACTTPDGYRLIAEKLDHNRIEYVRLFLPRPQEQEAPDQREPAAASAEEKMKEAAAAGETGEASVTEERSRKKNE